VIQHHLKHMFIAAAAVLVVLLALGVDLGGALRYAVLLACPLGMAAMMLVMARPNRAHGTAPHSHGDAAAELPPVDADQPRDDHERIA